MPKVDATCLKYARSTVATWRNVLFLQVPNFAVPWWRFKPPVPLIWRNGNCQPLNQVIFCSNMIFTMGFPQIAGRYWKAWYQVYMYLTLRKAWIPGNISTKTCAETCDGIAHFASLAETNLLWCFLWLYLQNVCVCDIPAWIVKSLPPNLKNSGATFSNHKKVNAYREADSACSQVSGCESVLLGCWRHCRCVSVL